MQHENVNFICMGVTSNAGSKFIALYLGDKKVNQKKAYAF